MKKNSRIYIAGHRGMAGSAIMRRLRYEGYAAILKRSHSELELTRQTEVENFFMQERPEYVFLAAAKVGGILANDTYKADFIYQNIMIAANVIHSAYKYGVKKLLNLGSSCLYPKFAQQPMKEDALLSGSLEPTNEPYAVAKISAIKLCRYYNEQFKTNFISVIPTNLYGPNDNFNLETSHVFPALIRKFHLAKLLRDKKLEEIKKDFQRHPPGFNLDHEEISTDSRSIRNALEKLGITEDYVMLWGTGEAYREFLYVDDLADACVFIMLNCDFKDSGEAINIGTGNDLKIKDFAALVKMTVGFEGKIRFDPSKPDGTPKKLLDVSRIKAMGWKAKTPLEEGIKKTYDWYRTPHA